MALTPSTLFPVDYEANTLLEAIGLNLEQIRSEKEKAWGMQVFDRAAPVFIRKLYGQGKFDGIVGMGGSGGTSIIASAMRALPIGVPKLLVSTVASGDVSFYVRGKDITMMPLIVDVTGLNRISRLVYTRAAGATSGMVSSRLPAAAEDRPIIAASMFGNTTDCVNACAKGLKQEGYEVLVFHATGAGGRAMVTLIFDNLAEGVMDITTTEWADKLCQGVFSAGPERLDARRSDVPSFKIRSEWQYPGCGT